MSDFERFSSFREALSFARELAQLKGKAISITRQYSEWHVELPLNYKSEVLNEAQMAEDDFAYYRNLEQEHYDENIRPIVDELENDMDSWARSDDSGWYYDD